MATRPRAEERITMSKSCSNQLTEVTPGINPVQCTEKQSRKWRFRRIGSRSLFLILAWQFIIECSLSSTLQRFNLILESRETSLWLIQGNVLGISTLLCISIPIASLLAEAAIGRYKLIKFSLRAMWLISICASIISLCENSLPVAKSALYIILMAPQYSLLGAFLASAVPLGIDQINGGTNANISAFIQWLLWAYLSGIAVPSLLRSVFYNCTNFQAHEVSIVMSLLPVLLLSVGLILDFYFHHTLVKEPVTVNPVSLIFKVLKYAAKHKYPVQRSAFTYCENERPTRLDYGKSKYGGPFTTEQVEDVKTFWRVLLVILIISMSGVVLTAQVGSAPALEESFGSIPSISNCIHKVSRDIFKPSVTIMYSIPLYELLIYPCLRNRGPSILQSAGIGAAALIASSLYGTLAQTIRQMLGNGNIECMFTQNSRESYTDPIVGIPFNFILGFTTIVLQKSSLEFVCAQAPYNMKGLLIGLYFTILMVSFFIGTLLCLAWSNNWFAILDISTCGIWFYLTTLVLAVVSSALLGLVIRWYKARERDETTRSQDLVEEVYHKYKEQAQQDS